MKNNDITIIIKTFNRKDVLIRLLHSIEKFYPELPIIIVDDSKKNYRKEVLYIFEKLNIKYIVEKYDIGLSAGRNILIDNVKTDYFLLCDDDFEFDERTDIYKYLNECISKKIDILGGAVYNRMYIDSVYSFLWTIKKISRIKAVIKKDEILSIYNGSYTINDENVVLNINNDPKDFPLGSIYNTDICSNFFIGNTRKIKAIGGWTPDFLKVGEHEFFFLKALKNNLIVKYSPDFGVIHYPKKTLNYIRFRKRSSKLFKDACVYSKLNRFIVIDKNGVLKYNFDLNESEANSNE